MAWRAQQVRRARGREGVPGSRRGPSGLGYPGSFWGFFLPCTSTRPSLFYFLSHKASEEGGQSPSGSPSKLGEIKTPSV